MEDENVSFLASVQTIRRILGENKIIADWLYQAPELCKSLGIEIYTPFPTPFFSDGAIIFNNGIIVLDYPKGESTLSTIFTYLSIRTEIFRQEKKACPPLSIFMASKVGGIVTPLETGDLLIPTSVVDLPSRHFRQSPIFKRQIKFTNYLLDVTPESISPIYPRVFRDVKSAHPIIDALILVSVQDVEYMQSLGAHMFEMELYYLATLLKIVEDEPFFAGCKLNLGHIGWVGMSPDSLEKGLEVDDEYPLAPLAAHDLILQAIRIKDGLVLP